jgi:hypothetical protein
MLKPSPRLIVRSLLYAIAILILVSSVGAFANPDPRRAIQAEYDRACQAASLKFIAGMELCLAPGFVETSAVGQKLEPIRERHRLEQIFATALSVKETIQVGTFRQIDAHHAQCTVDDVIDIVSLDHVKRQPARVVWESKGQDDWAEGPDGWQKTARRLAEETVREEALPVGPIP